MWLFSRSLLWEAISDYLLRYKYFNVAIFVFALEY